jgi:vacuolar-type H+-ATPase subunit E/Vma4
VERLLSLADRIHHVRHDLTRALDMLRLPAEREARAIVERARADLDAIAADAARQATVPATRQEERAP